LYIGTLWVRPFMALASRFDRCPKTSRQNKFTR
jgi:hypothetical protein